MKSLGIDFGTTNTAIAFFDDTTVEKKIISIPYHGAAALLMKKTLPSAVLFNREGDPWLFGEDALQQGKGKAHLLVDKIKRIVGRTYEDAIKDPLIKNIAGQLVKGELAFDNGKPVAVIIVSGQTKRIPLSEKVAALVKGNPRKDVAFILVGETVRKVYLPEEIVAMILEEAKKDAETFLRDQKGYETLDYDFITVTYPANFDLQQTKAILDAAVLAGFKEEKLKILNEPTAAAFDAVFEGKTREETLRQKVLVLNIGSGTTDLALVELRGAEGLITKVNTFATGGDSKLGGTDMDLAIVDWVLNQIKSDPDANSDLLTPAGRQTLRFTAEDAKISLSEGRNLQARVSLPGFESKGPMLSIETLEVIVKQTVEKCRVEFNKILAQRKVTDTAYGQIILTGGPMAMGIVRKMIAGEFLAPVFSCPLCKKRLLGSKPDNSLKTKGLPPDKQTLAQAGAWYYTHSSFDIKMGGDECREHLVFSDGVHYEMTNKGNEEDKWILADPVELKPRNHDVAESVDPMMCVARGAAISPDISFHGTLSHAIKFQVKGRNTAQVVKEVISLKTQLPCYVYERWEMNPWESNVEINVLQDIPDDSKFDGETGTYYGVFTLWGICNHSLKPSKDYKNVYVAVNVNGTGVRMDMFVLENESDLADWKLSPDKYTGTPLVFKQKNEKITIPKDGPDNPEIARVFAALRSQSPTLFRLLTDTYQLVRASASLQDAGFKLSEETSSFVNQTWPLFGAIYGYIDEHVTELAALKLSDSALNDKVKTVISEVLACRQYVQLGELIKSKDWETNMAHLTITTEAIEKLVTNIKAAINNATKVLSKPENEVESRDRNTISTLKNLLSSDLVLFQGFASQGRTILVNSNEGSCLIESQHKVESLKKLADVYA